VISTVFLSALATACRLPLRGAAVKLEEALPYARVGLSAMPFSMLRGYLAYGREQELGRITQGRPSVASVLSCPGKMKTAWKQSDSEFALVQESLRTFAGSHGAQGEVSEERSAGVYTPVQIPSQRPVDSAAADARKRFADVQLPQAALRTCLCCLRAKPETERRTRKARISGHLHCSPSPDLRVSMLEDEQLKALCSTLVSQAYVTQGAQELATLNRQVKDLLSRRRMPEVGWSEHAIERLLWVRPLDHSFRPSGLAALRLQQLCTSKPTCDLCMDTAQLRNRWPPSTGADAHPSPYAAPVTACMLYHGSPVSSTSTCTG
jgi:hypothetical protein